MTTLTEMMGLGDYLGRNLATVGLHSFESLPSPIKAVRRPLSGGLRWTRDY